MLHVCETSECHCELTRWRAAIYKIASSALPPRNDMYPYVITGSLVAVNYGISGHVSLITSICVILGYT